MKRLLTFLTLLTVFIGVGWAGTKTFSLTGGSGVFQGMTDSPIRIYTQNGVTAGTLYTESLRIYNNGEFIVTTTETGVKITQIDFTFSTGKTFTLQSGGGTWSSPTWTNSSGSSEVVFVNKNGTGSNNQVRVTSVTVTYISGDTPQPTTYNVNIGSMTNGSVSASSTSGLSEGDPVTLTINPTNGYELESLTVDNTDVTSSVSNNQYTFNMPDHDVEVDATFQVEQTSGNTQWVLTNPSELATNDVVLIVDKYSSQAMSNDNGTNNPPSATSVVLNTEKTLVTSGANSNLQWEVSKTASSFYFAPPGTGLNLYCTNTNNGVRVGTGENNAFIIKDNFLYNTGHNRYLGVYNNQDWRCYTSINNNIENTVVGFYKKVETGAHSVTVGTITGEGTITPSSGSANTGDKITITATPATGYELTALAYNGTAIDITSTPYTFIMPNADVTLTATFSLKNYVVAYEVTPSTAAANSGNRVGLIIGAPYDDQTQASHSQMGTSVTFKLYTGNGWQIDDANVSVAYTDANGNPATLTPTKGDTNSDDGGYGTYFTFTMPGSDVMINAAYLPYQPDLYILGNVNGGTHWNDGGLKMTFDPSANTYSIRIFASEENGYFRFYANGGNNGNPSYGAGGVNLNPLEGTQPKDLWKDGDANFCVPAGIYDIVVGQIYDDPTTNSNPNWWGQTTVTVTSVEPTFTFNPADGSTVYQGTNVTVTSNLYDLLHVINSEITSASVSNEVSLDGTTYDASVALDNAGSQTVTGKASYGDHLAYTATATYSVNEVDMNNVYTLVESADDLVAGGEYLIANEAGTAILGAVYSNVGSVVTTDFEYNASDKTIILQSGCTATPLILGGESGAWTFHNGTGFLAYTKPYGTTKNNNLFIVSDASDDGATWEIDPDLLPADYDLINNVYNSERSLQFNSDRFCCYTSNQGKVSLFKKATPSNKSAAPVITPESGNVVGYSQEVEITQSNGGTIYYTTDGTTPTETSTQYSGAFFTPTVAQLGQEVTVTAVAKEEGKELSNPVSVTYKFVAPAAPTFSPQGGIYTSYQYVELASATEGAEVFYTTDGSNPSVNNGTKYTEPIVVTDNVTIKAITVYHDAHVNKDATSGSRQAKYTIVTDGIIEVENIAEFNAIQPDENDEYPDVRFKNPVTVLYDYSQYSYSSQLEATTYQEYIWVKDESGFTQIFLRPSLNSNNDENHQIAFYENGDVIPGGFVVKKQYYETGEYYQAYSDAAGNDPTLPGNNVTAGFAGATQKALADPEPMTAQQLSQLTDNDVETYNNRYIRISKIKITNIDGKNFDFEDENGYGSNIAGYNKYSDATSYMKDGETLVTETINFPQDASDTYYDVTAILCTWRNGWEIMPISFTPWQANELTLRELCDKGVTTAGENEYTISNNLMCVFAKGNSIWVKDDTGQSIWMTTPEDGDENFEVYAEAAEGIPANTRLNQAYYDQSNWCELKLADGVDASQFKGQIIKGGSIHGKFTDKTNPTLENVTLTDAAISSEGDYVPNYYIPANFIGRQACQNSNHSTDFGQFYFYMTPKPQEYAQIVWAVWSSQDQKFIMSTSDNDNGHRFEGEFSINLSLNTGVSNLSSITDGYGYNFTAIIKKTESKDAGYMVYPLDLDEGVDPATAIESVVAGNGEVKSVKYVNVAGMVSDVPFQGVNIVVTEYTDGSRTTTKMLRK